MSDFMIGDIEFVEFSDPSGALARYRTELETRSGVNYHSTWLNGIRGEPTTIRGFIDVTDLEAGIAMMDLLYALIGEAVAIVWSGFEYPKLFDVLEVMPRGEGDANGVQIIALGVGGLNGLSGAYVAVEIKIIETGEDVPEPPPPP